MSPIQPTGMRGFTIVWIGQIVSLLGTSMTGFAMTIWAYEKTGSATALALVGFFFVTPMLLVSPIAGAFVDRHDRKLMMMLSDLASCLATIVILVLYASGRLEIWHLYITGALQGTFQSFQWPAYSAAITTMLSKEHYGRANGMMSLAESGSGIFAPLLAGALIAFIGISWILIIDLISFVIAIIALLAVYIPNPKKTEEGIIAQGSLWKEAVYGFRYILARPSLLGLQGVFLLGNFFSTIAMVLLPPMILASTRNNEMVYGAVNSAGALGGVMGGILMSAWGGPKKRVNGVLMGWILASISGSILMGVGRSLPFWAVACFMDALFIPIINGSNQAIWQSKVAPDLQGRVFSIRRVIAWFVTPVATLLAGPLADVVFEPGMQAGGSFTNLFGWLVGTGPGTGMAMIFIFCGIAATFVGLAGYAITPIRDVERILPDHDLPTENQDERLTLFRELIKKREEALQNLIGEERKQVLKKISRQLRELGQ